MGRILQRVFSGVAAVIVIGVVVAGSTFMLRPAPDVQAQDDGAYRTAVVERGSLRETVAVTAPLEAQQRVDLTFLQSGTVEVVAAEPGQRVQAGAVLMQLDTSQAQLDLVDAQLTVDLQRLALEQLRAGASPYRVASAGAAVQRAQAQLDQVSQPVPVEAIRIAEANLQLAESQRAIAYQEWSNQIALYGSGYLVDIAQQRAESAEMAVEIAKLELANAQEGASPGQIDSARAAVRQAQAALARLLEGPSDLDVQLAELQVEQAQLAVENARIALADATIVAPFDGVVVSVNYVVGEQAVAGLPAVTLIDDSAFHIDVLVDEVDVARVAEGQTAVIKLDAYPDAAVSGHVVSISPVAVTAGGVTSFEARIQIDSTNAPLRDGMTASVEIVVSELSNVLLVPNWAIRIDRSSGRAFVNVRRSDGSIEEIEIEMGVRGASVSEVRRGLSEGDVVVISLEREGLDIFGRGQP